MQANNILFWCRLGHGRSHSIDDALSKLMPGVEFLQTGKSALVPLGIATTDRLLMSLILHMVFPNRAKHGNMVRLIAWHKIRIIKILNMFGWSIAIDNTHEEKVDT